MYSEALLCALKLRRTDSGETNLVMRFNDIASCSSQASVTF